jgi:hypothetical protein
MFHHAGSDRNPPTEVDEPVFACDDVTLLYFHEAPQSKARLAAAGSVLVKERG